jgi:16S rRNA processing protein RimM
MIKKEDIFAIGQTAKPHGISGELSFSFTTDIFDQENCHFFIFEIDHIFVPFFIEEYRFKSNTTGFVKFEGIENEEKSRELSNLTIYLPKKYAEEIETEVTDFRYFLGFEIMDKNTGSLGKITNIYDDTANILFELAEKDLLIPASEEYITKINHKKRIIYMTVPEGLFDL